MASRWCVVNLLQDCTSFGVIVVNVDLLEEEVRGKNGHVIVKRILPRFKVFTPRKKISYCVRLSRDVFEFVVVVF
jgi:hypothetical protein